MPRVKWHIQCLQLLKTRRWAHNGAIDSKPQCHQTDTYCSCSPRNGILNQSIGNHLIGTSEVICSTGPCQPQQESHLAIVDLLCCLVYLPCSSSLLSAKGLHFVQLLSASLYLLDWMLIISRFLPK